MRMWISCVSQQMMNDVEFQSVASFLVLCVCVYMWWLCGRAQRQINVEEGNLASSYTCTSLAGLNGTLDRHGCQQRYTPSHSHRALMRGSIRCGGVSQPAIHPGRHHSGSGFGKKRLQIELWNIPS